jgi:hypothetical protein
MQPPVQQLAAGALASPAAPSAAACEQRLLVSQGYLQYEHMDGVVPPPFLLSNPAAAPAAAAPVGPPAVLHLFLLALLQAALLPLPW